MSTTLGDQIRAHDGDVEVEVSDWGLSGLQAGRDARREDVVQQPLRSQHFSAGLPGVGRALLFSWAGALDRCLLGSPT